MINDWEQLRNITRWRRRQPRQAVKLGNVINELVENRISPQQSKYMLITELWNELLPEELCRHCRITGISGGRLKVLVDSPSFASELRWHSAGLLEEIKQQCPQARIKDIQCIVGHERP
ncbi:MAG: DciA family protein [Planctomycetota bacterium]|jgi:predicted nucleic acid-binding Zn ribbon protein